MEAHRLRREDSNECAREAHAILHQAVSIAQTQKALAWELRLAMSLLEFARTSEDKQRARTVLSATINEFAEGFGFDILVRAESLLENTSRFD